MYDLSSAIMIFFLNAAMNLFGLIMELHNQTTARTNWTSFIFGSMVGLVPGSLSACTSSVLQPAQQGRSPPSSTTSLALSSSLQLLRHQHGPAVPEGREVARLHLRRTRVCPALTRRQVSACLADLFVRWLASRPTLHSRNVMNAQAYAWASSDSSFTRRLNPGFVPASPSRPRQSRVPTSRSLSAGRQSVLVPVIRPV